MRCCAIILVVLVALLLILNNKEKDIQEGFDNYANILRDNSLKKMRQWDQNHSNYYSSINYYLPTLDNSEPGQQLFDPIRPILAFPTAIDSSCGNDSYR